MNRRLSSADLRFRWLGICAFALSCAACAEGCPKVQAGNATSIVVLLDFSETFAPYGATDTPAIHALASAIMELVRNGQLEQPAKIVWAAFGNNGLQPILPCGPPRVFQQNLRAALEPEDKAAEKIQTVEALQAWLDVCVQAVMDVSKSAQRFTDISGALAFASNAIEGTRSNKLVFLYSDLREDLPDGRQAQVFDLHAASVVVAWRPGRDDEKQPEVVPARLNAWREQFKVSNVGRICAKPAQSLTVGDITGCLSN